MSKRKFASSADRDSARMALEFHHKAPGSFSRRLCTIVWKEVQDTKKHLRALEEYTHKLKKEHDDKSEEIDKASEYVVHIAAELKNRYDRIAQLETEVTELTSARQVVEQQAADLNSALEQRFTTRLANLLRRQRAKRRLSK